MAHECVTPCPLRWACSCAGSAARLFLVGLGAAARDLLLVVRLLLVGGGERQRRAPAARRNASSRQWPGRLVCDVRALGGGLLAHGFSHLHVDLAGPDRAIATIILAHALRDP